jgi:tRNA(Ile)-lysidine synthase
VAEALEAARASGLIEAGAPLVVMLSGGRDSVCLLDVARRLAGEQHVSALHVNYRLRDEADADEAHCAALCDSLGVGLTVERPRLEAGNPQARAREARYAAAHRLAGGALVATGHTATDQAETILYRLAASPGRRALLGMRPREGRVVRPLLTVTRAQTGAYCEAGGLAWREDESNDSRVYARNRVRHDLVAALRSLHPAAEANVVRTAELLRDEAAVLDEIVAEAIGGRDRVDAARLAALPPALRRLVARRLAEDAAGQLVPAAAERVEEILALRGAHGGEGGALDLEGGVRAIVARGELSFVSRRAAS